MMFWAVILVMMLIIIGASVLVGKSLQSRGRRRVSQNDMNALKTSGALGHRKEGRF